MSGKAKVYPLGHPYYAFAGTGLCTMTESDGRACGKNREAHAARPWPGWASMESAPNGRITACRWTNDGYGYVIHPTVIDCRDGVWIEHDTGELLERLTHWMPTPPGPEEGR